MRNPQLASKVMYAILLGVVCSAFALLLKVIAEGAERYLFLAVMNYSNWLLLVMPLAGLFLIYFLTKKVFKMPINGIREIVNAVREPIQLLKPVKAVIHFFTGIFTIVFGGSTGIEVSTVVGASALGSWIGLGKRFNDDFRMHLIIAGAAAGISALFRSPLAGVFFAMEVLMIGFSWELIALSAIASAVAFAVRYYAGGTFLFHPDLHGWKLQALPFYILFSAIIACLSVVLTRSVIQGKTFFNSRFGQPGKIWIGGALLGLMVFLVNPLYGEGYSFVDSLMTKGIPAINFGASGVLLLVALLFLKPIATSITLASGGDGGVFAPSLFMGAVAGCLFAQTINSLGGSVIEVNFIIVGMAAMLSASLHAPWTASALAISITGSYELLVPILLSSVFSSFLAKKIFPFTVYSSAA